MIEILEKKNKTILSILFFMLFGIAPFYYKGNLGGTGLSLPYNNAVWAVAITIIFYSIVRIFTNKEIVYVNKLWMIVAFPLLIIISSFFSGYLSASAWIIRQMYILGGGLYLLSLFQMDLSTKEVEKILFFVVLSMVFHAGLSTLQTLNFESLKGFIPPNTGRASGVLQQINVHASYLATGVIICFFIISRASFNSQNIFEKSIIFLSIFLCSFSVFNSGSRIGISSLLVSFPLLIFAYKEEYLKNRNVFFLALIIFIVGAYLGRDGVGTAVDKGHDIFQGYADIRTVIYSISIKIVQAEFIWGHGLGGFVNAWSQVAPEFYLSNPSVQRVPFITHPHNEFILWFIETGLLGITGIVIFVWGVIRSLINCGRKNGLGFLALLIPISFHTQVELPFYISSLHWFLWLFLIFMVLNTDKKKTKVISSPPTRNITIISIVYLASILFIYDCEMARRDLYHTMKKQKDTNNEYPLQTALNNLYFQSVAERLVMRKFMRTSIRNNDKTNIATYTEWAEEFIKINPELKVLEDLSESYSVLNLKQKRCKVVNTGLYIHGESKVLSEYANDC